MDYDYIKRGKIALKLAYIINSVTPSTCRLGIPLSTALHSQIELVYGASMAIVEARTNNTYVYLMNGASLVQGLVS